MILSSADILRSLGSSEIIRLSARLKIVDKKPVLSGDEYLYVCVSRFPSLGEFEATWTIWIEGEGEEALVIEEIKRLLPSVKVIDGLITVVTTTDFLSENTQRAPAAPQPVQSSVSLEGLEDRFQELSESIQDQMLLVNNGRAGSDGRDGRDGAAGRDGKDLVATDADLFDLNDVEQGIQMERGQVLTWDGNKWTNLYTRSSTLLGGGSDSGASAFAPWYVEGQETLTPKGEEPVEFVAGDGISIVTDASADPKKLTISATGGDEGGIPEAPLDGNYYVRKDGQWVNMLTALNDLGVAFISGPDEIEYIEPE